MDELEEKLGAILSDPKAMEQIYSMAQSLGQSAPEQSQNETAREGFSGLGELTPVCSKPYPVLHLRGKSLPRSITCYVRCAHILPPGALRSWKKPCVQPRWPR